MAFPAIHYGNFGDEKVTSTAKIGGLPLGIRMILPDGRQFVHARDGGTALVAGNLYVGQSAIAGTLQAGNLIAGTLAVGATTAVLTVSATTAVATDRYADGYLTVASSVGTGTGYSYKIKSNNSAAVGATCTVTLYETDPVVVATQGGTTTFGLVENENTFCLLCPTGTANYGPILGVACASAAASSYFWAQRQGMAAVKVTATILVTGDAVLASTATAGAVEPQLVSGTAELSSNKTLTNIIGWVRNASTTNGFSSVYMTLP